jgi:hypothetical protein
VPGGLCANQCWRLPHAELRTVCRCHQHLLRHLRCELHAGAFADALRQASVPQHCAPLDPGCYVWLPNRERLSYFCMPSRSNGILFIPRMWNGDSTPCPTRHLCPAQRAQQSLRQCGNMYVQTCVLTARNRTRPNLWALAEHHCPPASEAREQPCCLA